MAGAGKSTINFNAVPFVKLLFGYGHKGKPVLPVSMTQKDLEVGQDTDFYSMWKQHMQLSSDRTKLMEEYELMSEDDLLGSCLDLFAEEVTQPDMVTRRIVWVKSENARVEKLLDEFLKTIRIDDEAFSICRELALYGDCFNAIIYSRRTDGTMGNILGLFPIDPKTIEREEDQLGRLHGFYRGTAGSWGNKDSDLSNPWDYLHFRLKGRKRRGKYGTSMLHACRRVYKMLKLMEDAVHIYRLKMAPSRFMFGIKNLTGMSVDQRYRVMNQLKRSIAKTIIADKTAGTMQQQADPASLDENIFFDSDAVTVEHAPGTVHVDRVLDLEYFKKRLFMCLRIPPDYLGQSESKAGLLAQTPLAQQDVAFARYVKRLQKAFLEGLITLCQLHLAWSGIDPEQNQFTLHMQPVSYLEELQVGNLTKIRAETITLLQDIGVALELDKKAWLQYIVKLSGFPDDMLRQVGSDSSVAGSVGITGNVELTDDEKKAFMLLFESGKLEPLLEKLKSTSVESGKLAVGGKFQKMKGRNRGRLVREKIETMLSDTVMETDMWNRADKRSKKKKENDDE